MSDSNSGRHFASADERAVPHSLPNGWDVSSAPVPNGSAKADPGSTEEFMALVGAAPAAPEVPAPASEPAAPAAEPPANVMPVSTPATPAPAASPAPAAKAVPAPQVPAEGSPVNPLVAARAAVKDPDAKRTSPVAPKPVEDLYPIAEHPGTTGESKGKGFDTSFSDKGGARRRTLVIALVAVIVVALVAAVGFFVYRGQIQTKATENLNAAVARITDADEVVVPLDQAIASEISTSDVNEALTNAMMTSTTATNALSDAASLLDEAEKGRAVLTDDQAVALDAARSSVAARRSLLDVGRMLLTVDASVSKALAQLESAYAGIADANDKVKQSEDAYLAYADAAAANADTSEFDLWANVDLDNAALTDITSAQTSVAAAKEEFGVADYSALEAYLAARVTALQLLVQYDTCVANGDDAGADAVIDEYNAANDAMNAAAAGVPADARTLVRPAYAESISAQEARYEEARAACVDADATIRSYLGTGEGPDLSSAPAASTEGDADVSAPADSEVAADTPAAEEPASAPEQGAADAPAEVGQPEQPTEEQAAA